MVLSAPAYDIHRKTLQPDTASTESANVAGQTGSCHLSHDHLPPCQLPCQPPCQLHYKPKIEGNPDENGCFMFVGTSHRIVIYPTCLSDLSAVNLCQAAPSLAGQISQRSEAQANGRKDSLASSTCWAPLWFPCCNGAGDGFLNDFGPQHRHIPPHSVE